MEQTMNRLKIGTAAITLAAAGAVVLGGSALANAATGQTVAAAATGYTSSAQAATADTPVTGDEAAKAGAAVKAKDSAVTVTSVRKDPDGSYDVLGTKAGAQVMFDVSADLKTITQSTGHGGGHGGGSADTPVTGDEAAKAGAAVKAKDSAVTVTSVRKDPDGSYDVLGTKAGAQVMFDVSADLKSITQNTHS
jgi:hypothetical protein